MENKISIWVGKFSSQEDLEIYLERKYNADEESISEFMKDFKISYYDEDFREALCNTEKQSLIELIKPLSYSEFIITKIAGLNPDQYNSAVCLYNYEYNGQIQKSNKLQFSGVYHYR